MPPAMSKKQPTVLDPATAHYVLPAPQRATGEVVVIAPGRHADAEWRRAKETAKGLGAHFALLAENQQLLLGELRERLATLDGAIADASRAQIKGGVKDAIAVLDWIDVALVDLAGCANRAAAGRAPIDVLAMCREVATRLAAPDQPVFVSGGEVAPWWGDATKLAALVREALAIVAERTQGSGARSVDVQAADNVIRLAIRSAGDPGDGVENESVVRFRRAVEDVGALVHPDALGIGGSGMVIELPQPSA
jgi:hypothetical protein